MIAIYQRRRDWIVVQLYIPQMSTSTKTFQFFTRNPGNVPKSHFDWNPQYRLYNTFDSGQIRNVRDFCGPTQGARPAQTSKSVWDQFLTDPRPFRRFWTFSRVAWHDFLLQKGKLARRSLQAGQASDLEYLCQHLLHNQIFESLSMNCRTKLRNVIWKRLLMH